MNIMSKIIIIQAVILACSYLMILPNSLLANYAEKKFGDYENAINKILGSQVTLLIATSIVFLWKTLSLIIDIFAN